MKHHLILLALAWALASKGTAQPISMYVGSVAAYDGSMVNLTAVYSFNPVGAGYQWQKSTGSGYVNLSDGGNISGVTTTNLTIQTAHLSDAGDYRVVATNSAGSDSTQPGTLTILSLLRDVTSPRDVITGFGDTAIGLPGAISTNPSNAIDNSSSSYVNAGAGFPPFVGPAGLVVTPAAGPTRVSGLRIYAGSDYLANDPADFELEGSNDGGAAYSPIASGAVSMGLARNAFDQPLDPLSSALREILFENPRVFTTYRITFHHVANDNAAHSLQIGELELLGVTGPPNPTLAIARNVDGTLGISTSGTGVLQSCTNLAMNPPPWQDEMTFGGTVVISSTNAQNKFYRIKAQ